MITHRKRKLVRRVRRKRQQQIVREIQCRLVGHEPIAITVYTTQVQSGGNYEYDVMRCNNCDQWMHRGELDGRCPPGSYYAMFNGDPVL